MLRLGPFLISAVLGLAAQHAARAGELCEHILPDASESEGGAAALRAEDLITLRDIGPSANTDPRSAGLAVSPDGSAVAFQLRRADPVSNDYCLAMAVLPLSSGAKPIIVDRGGDFISATYVALGLATFPTGGAMPPITPLWSRDGKWIAYLRRDSGVTQVWRARADGGEAVQVTHADFDVEAFQWSTDDDVLLISGRPDLLAANRAIDLEGRSGYLYDSRFVPRRADRPIPQEPVVSEAFAVNLESGAMRLATNEESAVFNPDSLPGRPATALLFKMAKENVKAWTAAIDPHNVVSATDLHVQLEGGREVTCGAEVCGSILDMWWDDAGRTLFFQRYGSRVRGTEILRWTPEKGEPHVVFRNEDVIMGCTRKKMRLICAQESVLQPRRLVSIDMKAGRMTPLFDPNPKFSRIRFGAATRLRWENAYGVETWGDLVLPPDHRPGQRHPLIIVQYESRGFLRGGTGDEYPILLLAARGYAVLRFQKPRSPAMLKGAASWDELNRNDRIDWAERRGIQSSLDRGIDAVVAMGVADSAQVGLTGLSDGASTVQFALVNSTKYAAAAISTCCDEAMSLVALSGPAITAWFHRMGYPGLTEDNDAFWRPGSWITNASHIDTPILMQLADSEYTSALGSIAALQEQSKPVEVYVFPNEYHNKWQPEHRLAVYNRNIDWFDFWLRNHEDPDPRKAAQYKRWREMRVSQCRAIPSRTYCAPGH